MFLDFGHFVSGSSIFVSNSVEDQTARQTSLPFARIENAKETAKFQPRLKDAEFESEHLMTLPQGFKSDWSVPPAAQMAKNPAWWVVWIDSKARRVAVRAEKNKQMVMAVNGQISPAFDDIDEASFSRDGTSFAFKAKQNGKWHMVVNDEMGEAYEDLGRPIFSPQGEHLAYAAKQNGKWHMVVDNSIGPPFDEIPFVWLNRHGIPFKIVHAQFSSDGTRFAYAGKRGGQWLVVTDGKEGSHRYKSGSIPVFSPDGKHVAYTCCQGEGCLCILDDMPFPRTAEGKEIRFDNVSIPPVFSPDGNRLAFFGGGKAGDSTIWRMVLLGLDESLDLEAWKGQPSGITFNGPFFNHEGWAAWTIGNVSGAGAIGMLYVNGKRVYDPTKPMNEKVEKTEDFIELVGLFSGGRIAVNSLTRHLKIDKSQIIHVGIDPESDRLVITDRRDSGSFWGMRTRILAGPDFRHLANEYQEIGGAHVVVDGQHGPTSDQIVWGSLHFTGPDELVYVARLDRSFYRVTMKLPAESISKP